MILELKIHRRVKVITYTIGGIQSGQTVGGLEQSIEQCLVMELQSQQFDTDGVVVINKGKEAYTDDTRGWTTSTKYSQGQWVGLMA